MAALMQQVAFLEPLSTLDLLRSAMQHQPAAWHERRRFVEALCELRETHGVICNRAEKEALWQAYRKSGK